jgi:hypothetical protein
MVTPGSWLRQVVPIRIQRLNELDFLVAAPASDFLLASDCPVELEKALAIGQSRQVVPAGKAGNKCVPCSKTRRLKSPVTPVSSRWARGQCVLM